MSTAMPNPSDSILTSIKKMLMVDDMYEAFDMDIIIHINTVLRRLNQLGIGVQNFSIRDKSATWAQFLGDSDKWTQAIEYTYLRVRILFDPPQNSATMKAFEENMREFEWMLYCDRNNEDLYDDEDEPEGFATYLTKDGREYMCADGALYMVRKE